MKVTKKTKILVVDDDPSVALVTKSRLESAGFEVITARDGVAGLARATQDWPDLILLDLRMPKMDGWTFVSKFRSEVRDKKIPIIVVSAQANLQVRHNIEGIDDVIVKPFTPETLLQTILRHTTNPKEGN